MGAPFWLYQEHNANTNQRTASFAITGFRVLVIILFLTLIVGLGFNVYIQYNPIPSKEERENQRVVEEVEELLELDINIEPNVGVITDVNSVRNLSDVASDIYEDAQDGDYVLTYKDKLIIYRDNRNQIIYEGPTPSAVFEESLITSIREKVNSMGFRTVEDEQLQISVVENPENMQSIYPEFYSELREGDYVVSFPLSQYIAIYDPNESSVLRVGKLEIVDLTVEDDEDL